MSDKVRVLLKLFWRILREAVWSVARVVVPEVYLLRFRLVEFEIYSASFAVVTGAYEVRFGQFLRYARSEVELCFRVLPRPRRGHKLRLYHVLVEAGHLTET